jgi:SOS-response transcriptional repressor LexA
MDQSAILRRIEERLRSLKLSADRASAIAGRPDAIRNLRRAVKNGGRQGVSLATLADLAPALETTLPWLLNADSGDSSNVRNERRPISIPVVGKLAAGVYREVVEHDDGDVEYIFDEPDPEYPNAKQVAFTVEGDSLNDLKPRPILEGDKLICVDFDDTGLPLIEGMIVVIQRTRDNGLTLEWSAKQVELHPGRTEYHPRSTNKRHKAIVVPDDPNADTGEVVEVIALVRRTSYALPKAPSPGRR